MIFGTCKRVKVLYGFFMEVRENRYRRRRGCDLSMTTRVELSGIDSGPSFIRALLYLVRTRVMPGIEYRCCRAACGSCVISKARWKQTGKEYRFPVRVRR